MSDFVDTWIIRAYLRVILTNVPRCVMALPCRTYRPLAWRCHLNSGGRLKEFGGYKQPFYRKRSQLVTGSRWWAPGDHPAVVARGDGWAIATPEGWRCVAKGDWIVTDSSGSSWPLEPGLFDRLYEAVSERPT